MRLLLAFVCAIGLTAQIVDHRPSQTELLQSDIGEKAKLTSLASL